MKVPTTGGNDGKADRTDVQHRKRHSKYYIDIVVFEVEETIFSVLRDHIEKWGNNTLLVSPSKDVDHGTERHPIVLEDVHEAEFALFLDYLDDPMWQNPPNPRSRPWKDWRIIYRLATRWSFEEAIEILLTGLTHNLIKQPPIQQLLTVLSLNMSESVIPVLLAFIQQSAALSPGPLVEELGWRNIATLYRIKARYLEKHACAFSQGTLGLTPKNAHKKPKPVQSISDFQKFLDDEFGKEMKGLMTHFDDH
ncbi:hypothetical protein CVT24_007490 [Panaeolus cyanescens]|uniref:BTB domain-containing protein n=1 Tax=Panaeolus cyanescens TaxID=181874 RepID=A0A409W9I1_9AGAR|nr:hypothetical protein CVT24_007490 [Panaeolus cyanescens]